MPIPQFTAGQVLTAAQLNAMVDAINAGGAVKVERFTASGTFTPPTGVTYAVAYIRAGGGGVGDSAGTGGTSSVAFAGGTVSATGGNAYASTVTTTATARIIGTTNSGQGAQGLTSTGDAFGSAGDGALITAGGAVTAGVGITVTVGAGGTAGTPQGAAGGSGYVFIQYQGS